MSDGPNLKLVVTDPNAGPPPGPGGPPGEYVKMFPKKYQDHPVFKKAAETHKDISAFLEAAIPAFDATFVRKPGENATPEEKKAWNTARGVPEKPDDYKFVAYADVPMDEKTLKGFQKFCHDKGFGQDEANAWYENEVSRARGDHKASSEAAITREKDWKTQVFALWGADTPVKEDRFKRAQELSIPKTFLDVLTEYKILEHPAVKDYLQGLYDPDAKPANGARKADPNAGEKGKLFTYLDS